MGLTLRDKFFYVGILIALVASLTCAWAGPKGSSTLCLLAFWAYLAWAEIVLHVRAARHRGKTSDL